jgi:site-specific DNA-methyltransferase (adenine-specific)
MGCLLKRQAAHKRFIQLIMRSVSKVLNVDCMLYMHTIPDKFFDLACVDPPYGINADLMNMGSKTGYPSTAKKVRSRYRGAGKLKNRFCNLHSDEFESWDVAPTQEYFKELFRISKNQIIWGGNYFNLPPCRCFVSWDKLQPWENFSQAEFAWTSFDKPSKVIRMSSRGGANDKEKIHPTQKPISLYAYLLKTFAKEGDRIFDSHLGSGSSRIAAYGMGFDFYACEINKNYFDAQEKRFRRECFGEIKTKQGTFIQGELF